MDAGTLLLIPREAPPPSNATRAERTLIPLEEFRWHQHRRDEARAKTNAAVGSILECVANE
jgi:hypothetical protein